MCNSKQLMIYLVGSRASVAMLLLLLALPIQNADAQGKGRGNSSQGQQQKGQQQNNQWAGNSLNRQMKNGGGRSSDANLSQEQLEQLMSMREEEKLAHDVYVTLAQSSGLQVFRNISNAESKHMRAVEQLVSRYAPVAPLPRLAVGTFSTPQLQKLYTDLVTAGTASPTAALSIGAKIEEMDIRDLQLVLAQNPPQQVAKVLENLQRASGNHLRAFMGELSKLGTTYSPEFLDQRVFDSIVNSGNANSANGRMGMQMQGGKGNMSGRR